MYAMRPATADDADQIADLVRSRALWLRDRDDGDWREFHDHADVYRYYTDVQGWSLLRTVERKGATDHGFQRHAEPQPRLAGQIATRGLARPGVGEVGS